MVHVEESLQLPRDFEGFGEEGHDAQWPNGARIAVSFVLNYEEGGERNVLDGDGTSEPYLWEKGPSGGGREHRHLNSEQDFEYGSRCGAWRIHRLMKEFGWNMTLWAIAVAMERNPTFAKACVRDGHEIGAHGYRWLDLWDYTFEEDKAYIKKTCQALEAATGEFPVGAYFGRGTPNTANLLPIMWKEMGHKMLYTSEVYNDDVPYWVDVPWEADLPEQEKEGLLMVPYNYDCNDGKFHMSPGFVSSAGNTYFEYLKDTFDCLYREGGKMMTIPLHSRITGKPGRSESLRKFMQYVSEKENVWVATRRDIAKHYRETFPYQPGVKKLVDGWMPTQYTPLQSSFHEIFRASGNPPNMKPFTGITRFFSRDTTARVARVCIVNLKSIPSSVRCNSTLDKSGSLANSDSSDTVDTADAAETSSSLNTPDTSRQNSVTNTGVPGSARSKWTPDDRRILRDALERGMNHKDIAALFPSRTLSAVARQCTLTQKHLGLQGHSGEEHSRSPRSAAEKKLLTEFHSAGASTYKLRIHFPTRSSDSIAKALARYITHASTNNKAKPRWTLEERWKLTELCSQGLSIKELVEVLGRSHSAVSVQASKLGLKYADKRKPFSAEDVQVVLQMRDEGATYRAISAALGRKHSSTASYIYRLHRPKDRDIKPARCPRAQLSLDELGNVSALRAQRTPWSSIARQYPKHELSWIREQYRMWAGFDLSPTQLQEVERLREARKSWKYIADTGEFTCYSNDGIIAAYRRALAKQQTQG